MMPAGASDMVAAASNIGDVGPAQIIRDSIGDNPFRFCQASMIFQGDSEFRRAWVKALAAYTPNRHMTFTLTVEPDNAPGGYRFNTGSATRIYQRGVEIGSGEGYQDPPNQHLFKKFARTPQAHCESLGFFSNVSDEWDVYKTGWFRPIVTSTPPLPADAALINGPVAPNYNPALVKKGDVGAYSGISQNGVPLDDADSPSHPGFLDAFRGAESWSVAQTSIGRIGHSLVDINIGGTFVDMDYNRIYTMSNGHKVWADGEGSPAGSTALIPGAWDWRFFYAMVNHVHYTYGANPAEDRIRHERWKMMYWDIASENSDMPSGPSFSDSVIFIHDGTSYSKTLSEWILAKAYSLGIPMGTLMEMRVQAGVYAFRAGPDTVAQLEDEEWEVKRLTSNTAGSIRVWERTSYIVSIRQAMPLIWDNGQWVPAPAPEE